MSLIKHISEIRSNTLKSIKDRKAGIVKPFKTPWINLNKELINGIDWGSMIVIAASSGVGKAQPLTANVYTPEGKKKMGDLNVGDYVINEKGKRTEVLGIFPQGKKPVYKVSFSDGTSTECCEDHLWKIQSNTERRRFRSINIDRKRRKSKLPQIEWPGYKSEILTTKEIKYNLDNKKGYKCYIPLTAPVEFEHKELPINPYLLGLIIGDGSTRKKINITTTDSEILDYIEYIIQEDFNDLHIRKEKITYNISKKGGCFKYKNELKEKIKSLGLYDKLSYEKFVPDIYKYNNIETRLSILQGLLDTDGTVTKSGLIVFTSSSIKLAEDVRELIHSLGMCARIKFKYNKKYNRTYYNVVFCSNGVFNYFRLKRKNFKVKPSTTIGNKRYIRSIQYLREEEQQCLYVSCSSHLYLTDHFIVTHNTAMADQIINEGKLHNSGINIKTLKFQMEMTEEQTGVRELTGVTQLTMKQLFSADENFKISDTTIRQIEEYYEKFKDDQVYQCSEQLTVSQMEQAITEFHRANQEDNLIVMIDHSILTKKSADESSQLETLYNLSAMIVRLKNKIKKIIFIVLTQMNRSLEEAERKENGRASNYPVRSDIFGGDALLQCCDATLAIMRPYLQNLKQYGPQKIPVYKELVVCHLIKNRYDEPSILFFEEDLKHFRFKETKAPYLKT